VKRLRTFLQEIWPAEARTLVLCSHYVTLNTLCRLLIDPGEPPARLWAAFGNASVTRIDVPLLTRALGGSLRFLNVQQ
jgi:broad specificity phosphatase PhoE